MTTSTDADARLLGGQLESVAPFTLPLGRWDHPSEPAPDQPMVMPSFALTDSGHRLLRFAHHRVFDWMNDPDTPSWQPLLEGLRSGGAEDPVDGELDALWRCLLATFRAERFNEGLVATHEVALVRIGNELLRRLSERIAAGLHPPHAVSWRDGVVEAASAVRMPFETRGWSRRFQEELRGALDTLDPRPGHVLSAVYAAEPDDELVDTENVVFYNVGAGAFARLSMTGLRFERSFEPPFPDERAFLPLRHYLTYQQLPAESPFLHWTPKTTLARWDQVPLSNPSSSMKPAAAWWALRQAPSSVQPAGEVDAFGLRLVLHGPAARRPLAGVMKPLFDGVIAAFHGWEGAEDEEVAIRLAAQLGVTPAQVGQQLFDAQPNVLASRVVVRRRGDGLTWNPQDELCLAGELVAGDADAPSGFSGELFALQARPQP